MSLRLDLTLLASDVWLVRDRLLIQRREQRGRLSDVEQRLLEACNATLAADLADRDPADPADAEADRLLDLEGL
jgi:hypothetical protein